MAIYSIDGHSPSLANDVFVADNATVIGRVTLEAGTSVWFNAVLRGDGDRIVVGERSNVQDGAVLHVDPGFPLAIGARVSVGHQAMLHGCTIGAGSLIGIRAVVLNEAVIGEQCLVGAGAIVTEGKRFPPRTLLLGAPAKVARELTDKDLALLETAASNYMRRAAMYRQSLRVVDSSAPSDLASHGEI
ncbi:MAG: gamma carbonic anhydrase family protein [Burkholderiaceae bacterium]|nr:gamma carbonic anhydrase family protein [Burkholderiaceae bacterium]